MSALEHHVASLAYRKARDDIWRGSVPLKYRRVIPYVGGWHILEIGAAEGVLALLLAQRPEVTRVSALELRSERHREAQRLQRHWAELGRDVSKCLMLEGDIRDRPELFERTDTVVAVRAIYYLRDDAAGVIAHARRCGVRRFVLCGNGNRQKQYLANPDSDLGRFNRLASADGMLALLKDAGYRADVADGNGDPIVTGWLS